MQSTKHLLLLLAVLAFAAMNAVAQDSLDEANAKRCSGLSKTTERECNACCKLLSLESNYERRYKMAEGVWVNHGNLCVCMRTMTEFRLSNEEIREYTALLADRGPSAAAKAA
jgi:uncharacterized membrane protein